MEADEKNRLKEAWLKSAEEDLQTAVELFGLKRYSGTLFFCHLAIEKLLKTIYIIRCDTYPPPIHRLAKLAKDSNLNLSDEQTDQLTEITTFNVEARYDIFKEKLYKKATKEFTNSYLTITKDLFTHFQTFL